MKLFTVGFTKKSAEKFFDGLQSAGVKRVVDIRLNNVSQLAGFTKKDDLRYFCKAICNIEYIHVAELAPTPELLEEVRKGKSDWTAYEHKFIDLLKARRIEKTIAPKIFDGDCLLCSEEKPIHCHRRLVAEYLKKKRGGIDIHHLA
ncbi:MAG TPA: DUF488 domain-containing protein [Candidatus Angelobacter sp.]|jgi:uncharacterized protein (DUF488 family)|nr:DUF488 domain-containing protein [Candidatus Angelobacter sp.]